MVHTTQAYNREMIRVILFLAVFFICLPVHAQKFETKIHDKNEAELLLGRHLFSTQTISQFYTYFGEAHIQNKDGIYYLQAKHKKANNSDISNDPLYIIMKGSILEISDLSFKFKGEIELFYPVFMDKPCFQKGVFKFSRKKHPRYWRYKIQCSARGVESFNEYIDIFVKQ